MLLTIFTGIRARILSLIICGSFVVACSSSPEQQGMTWGAAAGLLAGGLAAASGMNSGSAALLGLGVATLVGTTVYFIAKHEANKQQRAIADQRAKAAVAAMNKKEEAALAEAKAKNTKAKSTSTSSSKTTVAQAQPSYKAPKYVAVDVPASEGSKGKASVMVYDAQTCQPVENSVYDLKTQPKSGEVIALDKRQGIEYAGGAI